MANNSDPKTDKPHRAAREPGDERSLSSFAAARQAFGDFRDKSAAFYPRRDGAALKTKEEVIERILSTLETVQRPTELADFDRIVSRAKDSLEESKKQSEYQDQKIARLLTIVAFLTAAAGAVFGKFVDLYPLHGPWTIGDRSIVSAGYALFGLYFLLVAAGALVSFYATQSRFKWEPDESDQAVAAVGSHLFFKRILRTDPAKWGASFARATSDDNVLSAYYKDYVVEAYLVAAKVGDKMRLLGPAQRLLLHAIRVLLAWILCLIVAFAVVVPYDKSVAHEQSMPPTMTSGATAGPVQGDAAQPTHRPTHNDAQPHGVSEPSVSQQAPKTEATKPQGRK